MCYFGDIFQFFNLVNYLFQLLVIIYQQLDVVVFVVLNWQIENVFDVKCVMGKKFVYVGYDVGMVVDGEFQNDVIILFLYGLFFYYFSIGCIWWYYWIYFLLCVDVYVDQCWFWMVDDCLQCCLWIDFII